MASPRLNAVAMFSEYIDTSVNIARTRRVTSVPTNAVNPITSGSRLDTMLPKTNKRINAITGAASSSIFFRSSLLRTVTSRSTAGCPPGLSVRPSCSPLIRWKIRASVPLRRSSSPVIRAKTSAV